MTDKKEYLFTCIGNDADLHFLQYLFVENGIKATLDESKQKEGQMGGEEILLAVIGSSIIPSAITAIGMWLNNRKKELIIEDKKNKKKIHLISNNGKGVSSTVMDDLRKFLSDKE